jgi:peptide/nickel transport system permease protein
LSRAGTTGLILLILFGLMAIVHPLLLRTVWPSPIYHPERGFDRVVIEKTAVVEVTDPATEIDVMLARLANPYLKEGDIVEVPQPSQMSLKHPLGIDPLGRDVLSMVFGGAASTYLMGLAAALTTALVGTLFACLAAYYRGWIDGLLSRVSDALLLLPVPILMIILGTSGIAEFIGPVMFGLIYGLVAGAGSAAVVLRSQALSILERPFIDSARVAGASPLRVITHHLLPHLAPTASIHLLIGATGAVVTYGFVSFLAYTTTRFNWGTMVYFAVIYPNPDGVIPWNVLLAGGIAISLFAASFYLIAQGIQTSIVHSDIGTARYAGPPPTTIERYRAP